MLKSETGYKFPKCKQQKDFEDMMKEIIKLLSEMTEEQQNKVFEFIQEIRF